MNRRRPPVVGIAILLLSSMLPALASATPPWCDPRRGAIGAVVGAINDRLGGHLLRGRVAGQAFATGNTIFGDTPTPSSAFNRCIAPRLRPRAPPPDPEPPISYPGGLPPIGDNGWIVGDPHITTLDRLRYTFGGAGDYVLVAADGVELQARFVRRSPGSPASIPSAFALRVDGVTVILLQDRDPTLRRRRAIIEGRVVEFDSGSWFTLPRGYVHRAGELWRIDVPGVLAVGMESNRTIIEVGIDDALTGPTRGLLGDNDGLANNDLRTADGATVDPRDTDLLYGGFLDAWLREGEASLFTQSYDVDQSGPVRPAEVKTLADFSDAEREAAAAKCLEAGVLTSGPLLECIYDLLVLDDETLLLDHREASLGMAGTLSAGLVFEPGAAVLATLNLGDMVAEGVPTAGAGRLARNQVDVFDLTLGPIEGAFLRVDAPCTAGSPVRLAWVAGGAPVEVGLGCGAEIPIPLETRTLSVFAADGRPQTYAFSVVARSSQDIGPLPLGVPIAGTWAAAGEVWGELVAAAGSRLSAQPAPGRSCLRDWAIVDGDENELARAPQCVRLDAVTLVGSPPFSLRLEDGTANLAYDFTLERGDGPETVTLTPTSRGEPVDATFELGANERIYVEALPSSPTDGQFRLLAPGGREVDRWGAGLDAFVEDTEPGTWTLRFIPSVDGVADVAVLIHRVPDDSRINSTLGRVARLTIVAPGQQASVGFLLEAGQRMYADRTSAAFRLGVLRLQGPANAVVAETLLSQQDLLHRAAVAGAYTLTWDGLDAVTGSIDVGLFAVAEDTRQTIAPGDRVTLEVTTPGQLAEASFELAAASSVQVSADVEPNLFVELRGPTGDRLRAALGRTPVEVDASTSGAGTYVLRLYGTNETTGRADIAID